MEELPEVRVFTKLTTAHEYFSKEKEIKAGLAKRAIALGLNPERDGITLVAHHDNQHIVTILTVVPKPEPKT